jgi:hypothetical protein
MKLYLDLCCFGRLFDDQAQPRVKLEAEAVLLILRKVQDGQHDLLSSEVMDMENDANPDIDEQSEIRNLLRLSKRRIVIGNHELSRAQDLVVMGFGNYDVFHIVSAESGGADYFLSTDDNLLKLGLKNKSKLAVEVVNPLEWLREI